MENVQAIQNSIYEIRGRRVMLDFDLARLYRVETKRLKEQVKRNSNRFPDDFMFQLTDCEWKELVAFCDQLPPALKHSYILPTAFTEQGVRAVNDLSEDLSKEIDTIYDAIAALSVKLPKIAKPLPIGYKK